MVFHWPASWTWTNDARPGVLAHCSAWFVCTAQVCSFWGPSYASYLYRRERLKNLSLQLFLEHLLQFHLSDALGSFSLSLLKLEGFRHADFVRPAAINEFLIFDFGIFPFKNLEQLVSFNLPCFNAIFLSLFLFIILSVLALFCGELA